MSAKENYELFKKFNTQLEGIKKNKKIIEDASKDKVLYDFLKDLKDVIYHTIHKELAPYKNIDNNDKEENRDGVVINSHICTNKELGINDEETILALDEDEQVGLDFFSLEENL